MISLTYPSAGYEKPKPVHAKPKVITESSYRATQLTEAPQNGLAPAQSGAGPYLGQIKTRLPAPTTVGQDQLGSNRYVGQTRVQLPRPQHAPIESKPVGRYVGQAKAPISTLPDDELLVLKPAVPYGTQLVAPPAPAPQELGKKIVQYYVPIIQDIDGGTANPG